MKPQKRSLIVGFFTIDCVHYVSHHTLEDCKINITDERKCIGGNAVNTANVMKQLDADVDICAVLAENNPEINDLLAAARLSTETCFYRPGICPHATIIVNEIKASRTIFIHPQNVPEILPADFKAKFIDTDALAEYSWIHFEGRNFENLEALMKLIFDYKKSKNLPNIKLSVEFEHTTSRPWFQGLVPLADCIFIAKEFARSKGWNSAEEALVGMKERFGASHAILICPWGEEGAYGCEPNSTKIEHAKAPQIRAVDTLGAGDCFNAGAIWAFNQGADLFKALECGVFVASGKCEQKDINNLKHIPNAKKFFE